MISSSATRLCRAPHMSAQPLKWRNAYTVLCEPQLHDDTCAATTPATDSRADGDVTNSITFKENTMSWSAAANSSAAPSGVRKSSCSRSILQPPAVHQPHSMSYDGPAKCKIHSNICGRSLHA